MANLNPRDMAGRGGGGLYVANLDSRGMVGTIYVEDHQTLIYTKYISCGPQGYRKDLSFSHYMSESY